MPDVHTPAQRSYNMSRIRGRDTRPELALRKALWRKGLRYQLLAKLPGRPDMAFAKSKVAVFIDGCFWHACPKHLTWPHNNAKFWKQKISGNVARDRKVARKLRQMGWLVIRFWEHDVKHQLETCVSRVAKAVKQRSR